MTEPRDSPGERRLRRPPSERYEPSTPETDDPVPFGSPRRGAVRGAAAAGVLAVAITVAGGILLITAGLLAVAGIGGWLVAAAVRSGAGRSLPASRRIGLAVGLALAGAALGQLGLWAYGELEGGVLGPIAYLAEVFGFLVPLQLALAGIAAWLAAR